MLNKDHRVIRGDGSGRSAPFVESHDNSVRGPCLRIRVVPYGELRRNLVQDGGSAVSVELAEGARVREALSALEIHVRERLIIGVDGEYATLDTPLHDGAEIVLVTPMEGG
jgi:molybdopterin converting factor small subunit